jgi:hypothetical protein
MSSFLEEQEKARVLAEYRRVGVCPHLRPVAEFLLGQGRTVTSFGTPWTRNCRNWVYFDGVIDVEALRRDLGLDPCVTVHRHRGTHDGAEQGFVCGDHHDGVMGDHPA